MVIRSRLSFGLAFSLTAGLITPLIVPAFSPWGGAAIAQVQLAPAQLDTFTDVSSGHWAHDYIEGLAELNVINGFLDGTFQPNEPVTRAEFAAILRQAFLQSQPITAQTPFSDVPANYWATNAIYAARSAGIKCQGGTVFLLLAPALRRGDLGAGGALFFTKDHISSAIT